MSSHKNRTQLNFIVGTAAELIKVFPLIFLAHKRGAEFRILSTGQGEQNFYQQYRDFQLPEDKLLVPSPSSGDLKLTSQALKWFLTAITRKPSHLRKYFLASEKARVVVHGDTLSTLVGAFWGRRLGLEVAHIEAGLRSPRLLDPFPEEINRRLVSQLARLHFAPSSESAENLKQSGVRGRVFETQGNTLRDALILAPAGQFKVPPPPYALVNLHRFENLNSPERWKKLVDTTIRAAGKIKLLFICHPQTRHRLERDPEAMEALRAAGVVLRDRMSFSDFLALLKDAEFLISDGGSNQEECSYLGKPCLLMRATTERGEGLNGSCLLSEFRQDRIDAFLGDWRRYKTSVPIAEASPSAQILDILMS